MTEDERIDIIGQVALFDAERARGIVHERGYVIKMEQYRLCLPVDFE